MKKAKKKYKRPKKLWDKARIEEERKILKDFGLKEKREIWKAETLLRKYRRLARKLAAEKDERLEKELIGKLARLGILGKDAELDDVLSLTVENILERRLQTVVFRQGLANTPKHARQFIVHGHVRIKGRKIVYPSYLVPKEEEGKIKAALPQKTAKKAKAKR